MDPAFPSHSQAVRLREKGNHEFIKQFNNHVSGSWLRSQSFEPGQDSTHLNYMAL